MTEIKKSIAFDIELAPPAKIPKSIAEKLQISKKEKYAFFRDAFF